MNKEIKEILDFKENADYKKLSCDEMAMLKDYITNLQQENKLLKIENKEFKKRLKKQVDVSLEQSKIIEKAVEYIKEHTTSFGNVFIPASESWYLSDILNGRSDE